MTDMLFGEFKYIKFYKHPVVFMGMYIKWFENLFYKDSILRGLLLTSSLVFIVFILSSLIEYYVENIYILGIIASSGIASKMLYDSVKDIIDNPSHIKYLVSRDTDNLTQNEVNKAAIETYAENLSDGVVAPLFYLLLFGLSGIFIYKAINTLYSMFLYIN
jgi:adenosylcobinamide-phosphate synthase